MSFKSLVNKLMKEGKSKTAATKIAGSVANAKMKGAGSGPTAKQKARAKSPATKKKPTAVIRDKDRVPDKSRSYTDKKGRKIEVKTFKYKSRYDSGVKDDPNELSKTRKSSRLSNTVELQKTKTKKDGTTKTKVKRAAGGGKKSQRLLTKFAKGKNKEGSSDVTTTRKSPTTMKSPAKKPLKGGQKSLPKELQEAILKSPGKMLTKSGVKMMDKSPATLKLSKAKKAVRKGEMRPDDAGAKGLGYGKDYDKLVKSRAYKKQRADEKGYKSVRKAKKAAKANDGFLPDSPAKMKSPMKKSKQKVEQDYARNAIADYKSGDKKAAKYEKKKALEVAAGESPAKMKKSPANKNGEPKKKSETYSNYKDFRGNMQKATIDDSTFASDSTKFKSGINPKYKLNMNMSYGYNKEYNPKAVEFSERMSPSMMKTNQDGGGYAAKNPAAPARQLKKLGSVISKHMKSGM